MANRVSVIALLVALSGTGCATQAQFLDGAQPSAMQTALERARFEMNCPTATGTVLSREVIEPPMVGPRMGIAGVQRAEFTIGVAGCAQRGTYVVICPDGGGCLASGERGIIRQ